MDDQKNKLNIKLSPDVAEGTYANLALITHSHSEFILDFVRVMPGVPDANVKARVILIPEHAKRLLGALQENVNKFEADHGEIKIQKPIPVVPAGFPTKGDA